MFNWRKKIFWINDAIKGGKVRKALNEITDAFNDGVSCEEIDEKINTLCKHAIDTTEYYKDYKDKDFSEFPIVNKKTFLSNYEEFISTKYKDLKDNRKMSTSGSTGTPFTMIQNKEKIIRCNAAVLFFAEMAGNGFGERCAGLRVWSANTKHYLKAFLMNHYMYDISYSDDTAMGKLFDYIKKKRIAHLIGYSSTYTAFVEYLTRNNISAQNSCLKSIIAASESLPEDTEIKLKNIFGITVAMRYSNMENGIIAERVGRENNYYIDGSSYYIEILDLEKDIPAKEGEVGRIVVTDLYNYAFPVIRYDTGDTGVIMSETLENGSKKYYLTEVYGRRSDMIYDANNQLLSPHVITNNLWDVPKIKQFKFIQTDSKTYDVELNVEEDFDKEEYVINTLKSVLGKESIINVIYVDEIPVLASGKRKYIENKWKN